MNWEIALISFLSVILLTIASYNFAYFITKGILNAKRDSDQQRFKNIKFEVQIKPRKGKDEN